MAEYTKLFLLGSGNHGQAWVVHKKDNTSQKMVLKEINLFNLSNKDVNKAVMEAEILAACKHDNIIKYCEAFVTKEPLSLCILMEYAAHGDLSRCIMQRNGLLFPNEIVIQWIRQLMSALDYIHTRGILHRDVKPQNLFLNEQGALKLGDFGIAKILKTITDKASTFTGTPLYISPEIYKQQPHYDQTLHSLVKLLLNPNPDWRPSAEEVLKMLMIPDKKADVLTEKTKNEANQTHESNVRGRSRYKQEIMSEIDSATYSLMKHPKVRRLSLASPELSTMLHRQRTQSMERNLSASVDNPFTSDGERKRRAPCLNILQNQATGDPLDGELSKSNVAKAEDKSFMGMPLNIATDHSDNNSGQGSAVSRIGQAVYKLHCSTPAGLKATDVLDLLENLLGEAEADRLIEAVKGRHEKLNCDLYYSLLPLVLLYLELLDTI